MNTPLPGGRYLRNKETGALIPVDDDNRPLSAKNEPAPAGSDAEPGNTSEPPAGEQPAVTPAAPAPKKGK
ncbi:hypothetical protein [Shinella sp.]|uniref:hypothetical protein n=1 Tax=Shinella sp. TaxID=1870904 RepID=UPI00258EBD14|nr:hypothetical protein [Shinella sp.]MCW5711266.1 hypothetical protein [Shinella sp.]